MSPHHDLSSALQDYLREIYKLQQEDGRATTSRLAQSLDVSPSSTTAMLKKLDEMGLVELVPYRGVTLTAAGEKVALEVIRHHRLIEAYLSEALGMPDDKVHAEAEVLEHHISEELEDLIAAKLGEPSHDPHGAAIPRPDLSLPAEERRR